MSFGMVELLLQRKLYGTVEIHWVLIPLKSQFFFSVLICNCLNCNYHALQQSYLHLDVPPIDDTIS